jgi:hypothetical protein
MNYKHDDLPKQLPQIFELLSMGRHISLSDHELFYAIRDNFHNLKNYFKAIGYHLEVHTKEFYYFKLPGKSNTKTTEQMILFICLMIDFLDKREIDLESALILRDFKVVDLPHFNTDRYKELLAEVGVTDGEKLLAVLGNLEKYGFASLTGKVSFRFRSPVYRFFDLCLAEINREEQELEEGEPYE